LESFVGILVSKLAISAVLFHCFGNIRYHFGYIRSIKVMPQQQNSEVVVMVEGNIFIF